MKHLLYPGTGTETLIIPRYRNGRLTSILDTYRPGFRATPYALPKKERDKRKKEKTPYPCPSLSRLFFTLIKRYSTRML